jgi:DNA replication ATP-dependent helicase Dna2
MAGDYYILNPNVKHPDAEKEGMSISLFRRLTELHYKEAVILRQTYRMNDHISNLSGAIAYKGLI